MITTENLKQAVEAIAGRDPSAGALLSGLLDAGEIRTLDAASSFDEGSYGFLFKGRRVPVRRYLLFQEGPEALEQPLLVLCGEERLLAAAAEPGAPGPGTRRLREAGLAFCVRHEIERALRRARHPHPFERLLEEDPDPPLAALPSPEGAPTFLGSLAGGLPAAFAPFPFSRRNLMQAADLDLEFFSVRFLLRCLDQGFADRLFACIARDRILGLMLVNLKERLGYRALEIQYLASLGRGARLRLGKETRSIRGVGAFLTAGAWLLWKGFLPKVHEIILDSELGALGFYAALGFRSRKPYRFALRTPSPRLLASILDFVRDTPVSALPERASSEAKRLARRAGPERRPPAAAPADLRIAVVSSDRFAEHLANIFHLESSQRYRVLDGLLHDPYLAGRCARVEPRTALVEELSRVHTPAHIARVAETAGKPLSTFDRDTQATETSYDVARLAAGGVFELLDAIVAKEAHRGFACIRPPGHHAGPDKAMGFCLFNNAALGAEHLLKKHGMKRVFIADIDAHHGNGTQEAFWRSNEVLYFSMHRYPAYPGTGGLGEVGEGAGRGFTVNLPLPRALGDRDLARALHWVAGPICRAFRPEIILVSLGFDLYRHDRLGGMHAGPEGYRLLTALLCGMADEVCGGRIAFILEGGYSIEGLRTCGRSFLEALCGVRVPAPSEMERVKTCGFLKRAFLKKAVEVQRKYWEIPF
jgi:acetoin utilization deacetylase AcuC-like enzyme